LPVIKGILLLPVFSPLGVVGCSWLVLVILLSLVNMLGNSGLLQV